MIKFIKNCLNRAKMSEEEYFLNRKIHQQAYKTCLKYLADYYTLIGTHRILALHKAELELRERTPEEIKKLAAIAILQFEQEEVEV